MIKFILNLIFFLLFHQQICFSLSALANKQNDLILLSNTALFFVLKSNEKKYR